MAAMEGSLSKWTNVMKGWQYRWFVLDGTAGILSYYTSREKMTKGVRRGCVRLTGAIIGIDDEDESTFTVTVDNKTFHFQARDADEREKWVRSLEDTIIRLAYGSKTSSLLYSNLSKPSLTIQDFDKKLSEADAYLQLIIEQIKILEQKKESLVDADDVLKCDDICSHANNMLEQMKHTIVLLQIAKNTAYPVYGTYQPPPPPPPATNDQINEVVRLDEEGISDGPRLGFPPLTSAVVPETSYSSSDEDDFYDAHDNENLFTGGSNVALTPSDDRDDGESESGGSRKNSSGEREESEPSGGEEIQARQPLSSSSSGGREFPRGPARSSGVSDKSIKNVPLEYRKSDGSLNYDLFYQARDESEIVVEGSVVKHLLGQVKIGMDLTKVTLPTFILERRSLLEMYADHFAHPDLFVAITDGVTPQDRMVACVRWYLSSFHAGRKSPVVKKPYNPILGEVFRCYYDFLGDKGESSSNGPVPWATTHQLAFVAEQVSHHPPISAFYAEHVGKRITCNAHIWTKSKFLGLSVGVNNIGQAVVTLMDHEESYTMTFPSGYGRSILTVPWIELGGPVSITCEKTGYHSDIEFLTKPFYGGKKHRIKADIFAPNEAEPFVTVQGEWNGAMIAKWRNSSDTFLDVSRIPAYDKLVRPVTDQEPNESRNLWKVVTAGLFLNDMSMATEAKADLEQNQRTEAQRRQENNERWLAAYFSPDGYDETAKWWYTNSLSSRLGFKPATDERTTTESVDKRSLKLN